VATVNFSLAVTSRRRVTS